MILAGDPIAVQQFDDVGLRPRLRRRDGDGHGGDQQDRWNEEAHVRAHARDGQRAIRESCVSSFP